MPFAMQAALIGVGATVLMDLWALLLRRRFGIPSLNLCLLGRWVLHMPSGTIRHVSIGTAAARRHECGVGWTAHYLIGVSFALAFARAVPASWLAQPTPLPALAFGLVTVVVPFVTLQPAFGLGIASSRAPHPNRARLKSVVTHTVFGLGLYLSALVLSMV